MNQPRPPIVAVMGHVDHGKTSLLDAIRKTNVVGREHGGITQHIGAYQVEFETTAGKNKVTFIDTPGHAAFTKMRARGAKVTDLVILVVAANDGVMPQTKESLEHIKAAGVPFIVAINKIDLPEADVNKVKSQLAEVGVFVEGYGGEVVCVSVSAKTGQGIKEILEMIALVGQMQNLQGDPDGKLEAVVIESRSDSRRGTSATAIVRNGSLKAGQTITISGVDSKIRALFDENGKSVDVAGPSTPVEVLGLTSVPAVGASISLSTDLGFSEGKAKQSQANNQIQADQIAGKLKILLKADVAGSLEALQGLINPDDVAILSSGVGDIGDADVLLAKATGSLIYGFNVKVAPSAEKLAEEEKVRLKNFRVIYELIEDLKKRVELMKNPNLGEVILGKATVLAEFKIEGERIAGCKTIEGKIGKSDPVHLLRDNQILGNARIKSLKHQKVEIQEAKLNQEFGAIFSPYIDFKIGDMLVSFESAKEL